MAETHDDKRRGVRIPVNQGTRSSTRVGRDIVADSLVRVDERAARAARDAPAWRKDYVAHLSGSTRLSVSAQASLSIAADGLTAVRSRLVHVADDAGDQDETSLACWATTPESVSEPQALREEHVRGTGERAPRLEVPYRGRRLSGPDLRRQLALWVCAGVMEQGFADAVEVVIDAPELLAAPGHDIVLLGAGAAMGPLPALMSWGADVTAIDLPVPAVWDRIRRTATDGAGRLTLPVDRDTAQPGVDLGGRLADVRGWLQSRATAEAVPVLGMYAYADSARHVELSAAADLLATDLLRLRTDAVLVYLNTPTDSFLVPASAIATSRGRWDDRSWNGRTHRAARIVSAGRMFQPQYAEPLTDDTGTTWGLCDTLVDVQGPSYALAKRIQRWRGVLARHEGFTVSSTVAPASWTASVVKNRVLASVYAGAHRFGVEIFQPETAAPLLAAKLVADLAAPPADPARHPESLFSDAAVHGGLWRQPFECRSALPVAALLGAPSTLLRRAR